jgi:hypothetical protein
MILMEGRDEVFGKMTALISKILAKEKYSS